VVFPELMVLGFISLLLTVFQPVVASLRTSMLPCAYEKDTNETSTCPVVQILFFVVNVYCLLFCLNLTPKMQKCTLFCHIQIDCLMEFWSCRVRSKSSLLRAYIRYTFSYLCWQ
jgi:hypothetical protein